jgi:predicted O-linked N-acetylglucosamine transferase (SPINDLY family)
MDGFTGVASGSWARLRHAAFEQVVEEVERLGANCGMPAAIALYRDWIALQGGNGPALHAAWFNLGVELSRAGCAGDAAEAYRRALALRPGFAPAAINLGLALEQAGEAEAALACWEQALQPDTARTALLNQRARLLEGAGRLAEAEAQLRRSLLTDPQQPDAVQHFVHLRQRMCAWPALDPSLPGFDTAALLRQSGPLAALALTDDVATQAEVAAAWLARKAPPAPVRLSPAEGYAGHRRIRLGYLSSDFCRHALSLLMAELFERHDRAGFEVFGYCASPDDGSDVRARVCAAFDHFRSVRALDDAAAARLIRSDEIDILVDLNGLTAGSRLPLLRWRPAPVQATYLGFVGPVPLPELDYLFCDDVVVPPAVAGQYRPAPLPIAPFYQANDSRAEMGPVPSRAAVGLPEERFVFACFANHYKITEAQFGVWLEILRRTDGAVLWLAMDNPWSMANLVARAAAGGVDPARLVFAPRVGPAEYRARLAVADLYLDTFPYGAGTVASDAMRAGLPVLTLVGAAFASRMAARLLIAMGAEEGIAETAEAYVARAVAWAADRAGHATFRARFAPERWAATIGDTAGFIAAYEATLRRIRRVPA